MGDQDEALMNGKVGSPKSRKNNVLYKKSEGKGSSTQLDNRLFGFVPRSQENSSRKVNLLLFFIFYFLFVYFYFFLLLLDKWVGYFYQVDKLQFNNSNLDKLLYGHLGLTCLFIPIQNFLTPNSFFFFFFLSPFLNLVSKVRACLRPYFCWYSKLFLEFLVLKNFWYNFLLVFLSWLLSIMFMCNTNEKSVAKVCFRFRDL